MFLPIDHLCNTPGCDSVVVIDGNMKNARQVCSCKNVSELEFDGLEGSISTGIPIDTKIYNLIWCGIKCASILNVGTLTIIFIGGMKLF